jgi:hypothetical protein
MLITINFSYVSLRHSEVPCNDAACQAALEGEQLVMKKKKYWLMGRKSALLIHNNLMLYKY